MHVKVKYVFFIHELKLRNVWIMVFPWVYLRLENVNVKVKDRRESGNINAAKEFITRLFTNTFLESQAYR